MSNSQTLKQVVLANREGKGRGIYSVCSANRYVLEAAMLEAKENGTELLIEATCNQVNQEGGYTGMTPADFVTYIEDIANTRSFDMSCVILGGDHLGPNPWRKLKAAEAMTKAMTLVEDYVAAGFSKIHLDASMSCADDPVPLPPEVIAERAAQMCKAAESVVVSAKPHYIIGTEVPIPGGAQEGLEELAVTSTIDLSETVATHQTLFADLGIESAFERVIGVVVQPGVEFDHASVIEYQPNKALELKSAIHQFPNIVFEAHSTDYQTETCLSELVKDHFAILKVGPGLTFAFREAVFALSHIEEAWIKPDQRSNIRQVIESTMVNSPKYWEDYYYGDSESLRFARQYSFSDRSRYYWNYDAIEESLDQLIENLSNNPPPYPLVSQFMPSLYNQVREKHLAVCPKRLLHDYIRLELGKYARACKQFGAAA